MSSQSSPDGLASSTYKVSQRWSEAQEWELELWRKAQNKRGWKRLVWPVAGPVLRRPTDPRSGDNWNRWWRERFDHIDSPAGWGTPLSSGVGRTPTSG